MAFTQEQIQAIKSKGANLLVSAAAGSGKTTVLVERIINKITNENVDIDKLLIVTFTSAAASEMKEKILKALYEKIDKDIENVNLQKQISLINKAHISTISSFCLDVIRNNFFEIGLSANFRVGDQTEIELMKQEALEELFEKKYEENDEDFINLLDLFTSYNDDSKLKEVILKIFDFVCSVPYEEKWLNEKVNDYNLVEDDFLKTKWGKIILKDSSDKIEDGILNLENAKNSMEGIENLSDCYLILSDDINSLKSVRFDSYDNLYNSIHNINFSPWSRKRKYDEGEKEIKDEAKSIRDSVIQNIKKMKENTININNDEAKKEIKEMYQVLKKVKNMVLEFKQIFDEKKREKNVVDFSDIEHFALKILVDENNNKTEIAKKYDFNEILIDEYQDSNLVQESILNSVSNGHNIFMVGDVKQSIYRFRQARPELFMKKYKEYTKIDGENNSLLKQDTKIQLYKNFRSRKEILDFTNIVFQDIMSESLGEINYDESEYLNLGLSYEDDNKIDYTPEMYVISLNDKEKTDDNNIKENIDVEDDNLDTEIIEKNELESYILCKKIKEFHNKGFKYRDMCVLLRSQANVSTIYEKEMIEENIPVYSDTSDEYLKSIEIDTIISLLKIIDNPLQDIPLVTVLKSEIGNFDDNELIEIRLNEKNKNYYYALKKEAEKYQGENNLSKKAFDFIQMIEDFREKEKQMALDEFIWYVYNKTQYYDYVRLMPNGKLRQANLRKLFEKAKEYEKISFKGLFNFITFIEKIEDKNEMSEAKIIGENDDVVRIMSIHKSKGLEFKIVFLCNIGKRINEIDLKEKIILDHDMGIGMNYITEEYDYPSLVKNAIAIKAKNELYSEEMRILYVALTRAKEKLVLIGTQKNAEEMYDKKEKDLETYSKEDSDKNKINHLLVAKYNNYLDLIELVSKYSKDEINLKINFISKNDVIEERKKYNNDDETIIKNKIQKSQIDKDKYEKIDRLLNWQYEYLLDKDIPTKSSVTALKNDEITFKDNDIIINDKIKSTKKELKIEKLDDLLYDESNKENKTLDGKEKGTLIHLCLQKLNDNDIDKMIENLNVENYKKEYLRNNKIIFENYINSNLFKEIKNAKKVFKEAPFYVNVNYNESKEKVLVQGVIDLYFIDENDNLILVDYKTDKNVDEAMLKERYYTQLTMYEKALNRSYKNKNLKVNEKIIYSTFLNKEIIL